MLSGLLDCYKFADNENLLPSSSCNYMLAPFSFEYMVIIFSATICHIIFYSIIYYRAKEVKEVSISNEETNSTQHEWKPTPVFSLLFVSLIALVLATTTVGVIIFSVSSNGELSPASYV